MSIVKRNEEIKLKTKILMSIIPMNSIHQHARAEVERNTFEHQLHYRRSSHIVGNTSMRSALGIDFSALPTAAECQCEIQWRQWRFSSDFQLDNLRF